MLKTTVLSQVLAANEVDGVEDGDELIKKCGKLSKTEKLFKSQKLSKSGKSKSKKTSKSWNLAKSGKKLLKSGNSTNFDAMEDGPKFLTPDAKIAFNYLRLAFTKAPILWHFDPECHIWIETDVLGYTINSMLDQLASEIKPDGVVTKTDLRQWHPVAFFLRKMIPAETWYKTHNGKLLAIIEAFKPWRPYLKGCKHKVLIFIDHNNLCCFMDIKSLSSRQV